MTIERSNVFEIPVRGSIEEQPQQGQPEGCGVLHAISDALAILDAIGQGGLLEALPECDEDHARFRTGLTLLDIMERRLREAVGNPDHLISDECRCNSHSHCGPSHSKSPY
jgi:hypothetical protein